MSNLNIFVISGGYEWEHKISLRSGYDVTKCLLENNHKVYNICITQKMEWRYSNNKLDNFILYPNDIKKIKINLDNSKKIFQIGDGKINNIKVDRLFLTTHGKYGEDGTIQGFLNMNKIKYSGSDILGSAIGMDKDICKKIISSINIPVIDSITLYKNDNIDFNNIYKILGDNYFIKIVNGGSSIGTFVADKKNIKEKINEAFKLNNKILIEKKVKPREVEIGLIENNLIEYSEIGEIIKINEFYNYDQKYLDDIDLVVPANINSKLKEEIINYAIKIFKTLNLKNYCRIDFFLIDNKIFFNEINTLPGFQETSMFLKMWKYKYNYYQLLKKILKIS